jgi:hypothetical protein
VREQQLRVQVRVLLIALLLTDCYSWLCDHPEEWFILTASLQCSCCMGGNSVLAFYCCRCATCITLAFPCLLLTGQGESVGYH